MIILGEGARRMSARELEADMKNIHKETMKEHRIKTSGGFRQLQGIKELIEEEE